MNRNNLHAQGEFEHQDSTGAKGRMSSGDVRRKTAGIIHSEMPTMSEGKLHDSTMVKQLQIKNEQT